MNQTPLSNNVLAIESNYYARWAAQYVTASGGARVITPSMPRADLEIVGLLMPTVTPDMAYYGVPATGYDQIAAKARELAQSDKEIITIFVESGGGYVWGIDQAIEALRELHAVKRVEVEVGAISASAAYWLSSISHTIKANRFSEIGGIGAFIVIEDFSEMAKNCGVDVKVIKSGKYKGVGVPGAPIADDELDPEREQVTQIADMFLSEVQAYRPVDSALATGRTWIGLSAVELGLADALTGKESKNMTQPKAAKSVRAEDEVMPEPEDEKEEEVIPEAVEEEKPACEDAASADPAPEPEPEGETVPPEDEEDKPEARERKRCAALVVAFADDAQFAKEMIDGGVSLVEAKAQYFDRSKLSKPAGGGVAVVPANRTPQPSNHTWTEAVEAYSQQHNVSRMEAASILSKQQPELYRQNFGG